MATTVTLKPNAIDLSGSTSGTTTLQASAVAGTTTVTLPAATDTLVGKATTDTLTNKTLTSPTMTAPVLGTPASGTVTNLTGTASININGTVGATTATTGAFTTLGATGNVTLGASSVALPTVTLNSNNGANQGGYYAFQRGGVDYAYIGSDAALNSTGANSDFSILGAGDIYLAPKSGGGSYVKSVKVTSTGLAVTGTLSATLNQNADTTFRLINTTSGTAAGTSAFIGNGTSVFGLLHYNASHTAYGNLLAEENALYSGSQTVRFANDIANPIWKWTGAAGLTTDYMSLTSTGLALTNILDLSAATAGQIKFPATQNASSNANTLDDYDEYTAASAACTGAITTAAVWKLTKVGNVVTLTLPNVVGTASAAPNFTFGTVLPSKYRPSGQIAWCCSIKDNAANIATAGSVVIDPNGNIYVYKDGTETSNFTSSAVAGFGQGSGFSCSWTI